MFPRDVVTYWRKGSRHVFASLGLVDTGFDEIARRIGGFPGHFTV